MNLFNRIVVVLGILLLGLGCTNLLMMTLGIWAPEQLMPSPWYHIFTPFTNLEGANWWSVVLACVVVLSLGIGVLWVELAPHSRKESAVTINQDNLGQISATLSSIQDLVNREAGKIDGVLESSTKVKEVPGGLHLHCRVSVSPQASANPLGHQIQTRVKEVVEHYLGKPIVGIHVQTQIASFQKSHKKTLARVR